MVNVTPNSTGALDQTFRDLNHLEAQANYMQNAGKVNDAGFGMNDVGLVYDTNNADSFIDAMNQRTSWQRDDTYYQRLFKDLKAAGINPAVLFASSGGATGVNGASSFKSSSVMDARHKKAQEQLSSVTNTAKVAGAIAAILTAIAMAA